MYKTFNFDRDDLYIKIVGGMLCVKILKKPISKLLWFAIATRLKW